MTNTKTKSVWIFSYQLPNKCCLSNTTGSTNYSITTVASIYKQAVILKTKSSSSDISEQQRSEFVFEKTYH